MLHTRLFVLLYLLAIIGADLLHAPHDLFEGIPTRRQRSLSYPPRTVQSRSSKLALPKPPPTIEQEEDSFFPPDPLDTRSKRCERLSLNNNLPVIPEEPDLSSTLSREIIKKENEEFSNFSTSHLPNSEPKRDRPGILGGCKIQNLLLFYHWLGMDKSYFRTPTKRRRHNAGSSDQELSKEKQPSRAEIFLQRLKSSKSRPPPDRATCSFP